MPALPAEIRAFLISQAGFSLRPLGRLAEAVDSIECAAGVAFMNRDWLNASRQYHNSERGRAALGQMTDSIESARNALLLATRGQHIAEGIGARTVPPTP